MSTGARRKRKGYLRLSFADRTKACSARASSNTFIYSSHRVRACIMLVVQHLCSPDLQTFKESINNEF